MTKEVKEGEYDLTNLCMDICATCDAAKGLTPGEVRDIIEAGFHLTGQRVVSEERVDYHNIGVFKGVRREPKKVFAFWPDRPEINEIQLPARLKIVFVPSPHLVREMNKPLQEQGEKMLFVQ